MNTQENILVKANIQKEGNSKRIKIIFVVYQSLLVFLLMIGLISGNKSGLTYKTIGWFDISFYYYNLESGYYSPYTGGSYIYEEAIIAVTVIFLLLCSIPLLLEAIQKRQRQNTSLTISGSTVYGSYDSFLFKKSFDMPIEKVESITVSSNFADEIRTGKTLELRSASGNIKLHFVQNAEEIVDAKASTTEKIKKEEEIVSTNHDAPQVTLSEADKIEALKKYKELKDQGIITEEEFETKKSQLLK